jgi:DNA-directed RNA polymerase specialized sigma24 family protein
MQDSEVEELQRVCKTIFSMLRRAGKIPARLNEEEYEDAIQEGFIEALGAYPRYDASRGSLVTYLYLPVSRAITRYAWKQATLGITGDHDGVQVHSLDTRDYEVDGAEEALDSDSDIEHIDSNPPLGYGNPETEYLAFESVWNRLHNPRR